MVSQRLNPPWLRIAGMVAFVALLLAPNARAGSSFAWSPDGKWVAYVDQSPPAPARLPVDWFFKPSNDSTETGDVRPPAAKLSERSRLWVTQVQTRKSVLIEDAVGTIAAPIWSPDGRSIAFVRMIPSREGRGTAEIVIRDTTNRRVLLTKAVDDLPHEISQLPKITLAWSPDGKFIAVPAIQPMGVAIFRVDTGRLIKSLDGAMLPAWSPDGTKLLYVSTGDEDWLELLDSHFGASRHLADVGHLEAPPIFSRDGQTVITLSRARTQRGATPPSEEVELWRVRVDDNKTERLTTVATTSGDRILHSTSVTADRDGENVVFATSIANEPSQVSRFHPRERSVVDKFPMLDPTLSIENLALSPVNNLDVKPSGAMLALRLNGLPLLCDLDSRQLVPLTPDADLRAAWTAMVLTSADQIVRELRPQSIVAGHAIKRPIAPPMPGELEFNSEALHRFRRFGRIGHDLIDKSANEPSWELANLIFDYLREDYPAALQDIEAVETHEADPNLRLRLLNLRAQVFVGLSDFERARGTLAYLKSLETTRSRKVIEESSSGVSLLKVSAPDAGWTDYALGRIARLEADAAKEDAAPIEPTDHRNFDAPQPGLGLDIIPEPPKNLGPLQIRPDFPNQPLPDNRRMFLERRIPPPPPGNLERFHN